MQIISYTFLYHEILQTTSVLLKMDLLGVKPAAKLLRVTPDTTNNKEAHGSIVG
jgi:hypothetical protein